MNGMVSIAGLQNEASFTVPFAVIVDQTEQQSRFRPYVCSI